MPGVPGIPGFPGIYSGASILPVVRVCFPGFSLCVAAWMRRFLSLYFSTAFCIYCFLSYRVIYIYIYSVVKYNIYIYYNI